MARTAVLSSTPRVPARSLFLPGVSGNYASCPDSIGNSVTGDIDVRIYCTLPTVPVPGLTTLISKYDTVSAQRSWRMVVSTNRTMTVFISTTGVNSPSVATTAKLPISGEVTQWFRFTRVASSGLITIFTSVDGLSWTVLDFGTATTGALWDSTGPIEVGSRSLGTGDLWGGKVYYAEVRNGVDGTIVANPDFRGAVASGFTDSVGNPWTINTSGTPAAALVSRSARTSTVPANSIFLPGVVSNYISAPDSVPLSIVGDIDIRILVAADNWNTGVQQKLIAKRKSAGRSWCLLINSAGRLALLNAKTGAADTDITRTATVAAPTTNGVPIWIRATLDVDNGAAGNDGAFYTSSDGITWTQLGTTVTTAGVTNIIDSTASLRIGIDDFNTSPVAGRVFYAEVRDGIGGTIVASPDFRGQGLASGFSDAQGNVWTVNTSGSVPAALVTRTLI